MPNPEKPEWTSSCRVARIPPELHVDCFISMGQMGRDRATLGPGEVSLRSDLAATLKLSLMTPSPIPTASASSTL